MRMKTAFRRWQDAGCPTIPPPRYMFKTAATMPGPAAAPTMAVQMAEKHERQGWLSKAAGAFNRFMQRRRA